MNTSALFITKRIIDFKTNIQIKIQNFEFLCLIHLMKPMYKYGKFIFFLQLVTSLFCLN